MSLEIIMAVVAAVFGGVVVVLERQRYQDNKQSRRGDRRES